MRVVPFARPPMILAKNDKYLQLELFPIGNIFEFEISRGTTVDE